MSAALGRVGWRGRDTATEGERERESERRQTRGEQELGEEGEAKRARPNRGDVSGRRERTEQGEGNKGLRLDANVKQRRNYRRREEGVWVRRRGEVLDWCLTMICMDYDAS